MKKNEENILNIHTKHRKKSNLMKKKKFCKKNQKLCKIIILRAYR